MDRPPPPRDLKPPGRNFDLLQALASSCPAQVDSTTVTEDGVPLTKNAQSPTPLLLDSRRVHCTERSLREMLAPPYGTACGRAILDWVHEDKKVTIEMLDGTVVTLNDVKHALELLERLGWQSCK